MEHRNEQSRNIQTTFLSVNGMMCGSCGAAVEAILKRQPGVAAASVNFVADTAYVEWYPERVSLDELLQALARSGYRASETGLDAQNDETLDAFRRNLQVRLAIAVVFGMWSMLAAMLLYLEPLGVVDAIAKRPLAIISGIFAIPVITISGFNFYRAGWRTLRGGVPGMDTLITLASLAAVAVSVWQLAIGSSIVYFDVAVMLITFQLVARIVDHSVRRSAGTAARAFLRAVPSKAQRVDEEGGIRDVPCAALLPGDVVRVVAGERIPVDGVIAAGHSAIDESLLSGESRPRVVSEGETILAGCRNLDGELRIRVTKPAGKRRVDSLAQGIRALLARKSSLQQVTDRIARVLIPVVVIAAALAMLLALTGGGGVNEAVFRAIAVLVVTCPCALSLAVPLVTMAASNAAVRSGMILRDPAALEAVADVKTIVFDKTGTLTGSEPCVERIDTAGDVDKQALLSIAANATAGTAHPLARGLSRTRPERHVNRGKRITHAGNGVEWRTDSGTVLAGRAEWLRSRDIPVPGDAEESTHVAVARDGIYLGIVRFAESIRPEVRTVIHELHRMGCSVSMLSGDTEPACRKIGAQLHLSPEEVHSAKSPEDKLAIVQQLETRGPVLFAGDGLNDGPGLAAARFGVAIGESESSASAAAAVQLRTGLQGIPFLVHLSRLSRRAMRHNLAWALAYNGLALPAAMAGFVHPAIAAVAMGMSTMTVLLNSVWFKWRLDRYRVNNLLPAHKAAERKLQSYDQPVTEF